MGRGKEAHVGLLAEAGGEGDGPAHARQLGRTKSLGVVFNNGDILGLSKEVKLPALILMTDLFL
jgi:hypothetical protein